MNKLQHENSPYLLQHKDNPVWWRPWGAEAFQIARAQNKPVFLSVGYSTCHWCHVMEGESFEDEAVAAELNKKFVSIKVDREERPDIDDTYMLAVQQMTGHGGWPMSVWLTPDGHPFFAGTYFRRHDFIHLLTRIGEAWDGQAEEVKRKASDFSQRLKEALAQSPEVSTPTNYEKIIAEFVQQTEHRFDSIDGGFGHAPKFPASMTLKPLMEYSYFHPEDEYSDVMIKSTLDAMMRGGIHDHLNGGFHRYATDEKWLIPHFEKMLYDNAFLAMTYLDASRYYKREDYALVAQRTLDYVLAEMTHEKGGFFSAQDADSMDPQSGEKQEGYFATYSWQEIQECLSDEQVQALTDFYDLCPEGHYEQRNILNLKSAQSFVDSINGSAIQKAREKLGKLRASRPTPHLDDKILAAWNGWMISALCCGYEVLKKANYLEAAERAVRFVQTELMEGEQLFRSWRQGRRGSLGFCEDYAAIVGAFLDFFEVTFDEEYLEKACLWQGRQDDLFWDDQHGGYYQHAGQDQQLFLRKKDDYDGVIPSSNSMSAQNLLRLAALTGDSRFASKAQAVFAAFSYHLNKGPLSLPWLISALGHDYLGSSEIAITKSKATEDISPWLRVCWANYLPYRVVDAGLSSSPRPLLHGRKTPENAVQTYVCQSRSCYPPLAEPEELQVKLNALPTQLG